MLLTRNRFIVQQDTPSSYSGQTGLFTRVNAAEDALEFVAAGGGVDISARVRNSVNISIASGVGTVITFDTEDFDTDGIHSLVTNTGRLTAQTAGKYLIVALLEFTTHATGWRNLQVRLNGVTNLVVVNNRAITIVQVTTRIVAVTLSDLAVNDYIECIGFQDSGGALDIGASPRFTPVFGMVKVLG